MYNITPLQQAPGIYEIFLFANTSANALLFGLIMIGIFFILLYLLKRWGFAEALLSSSFACFVLSGFLVYIKLLNFYFLLAFLIILALTGLYVFMIKK